MNEVPETQQTSIEETPSAARKSRRWLWVILGVFLVLVLAAAAFLGGRYLQKSPLAAIGADGMVLSSNGPGGGMTRSFSKSDILPAEELPKTAADVAGIFVRRQDNSLFVGTGRVQLQVRKQADNPNSTPESASSYDGPLLEVVTTTSTQVYRDDTFQNLKDLPSSNTKVQQKVVPGSLDEIGQNSAISAWGKKVGDRLVADVILYSNPFFVSAPGSNGK